MNEKIEIRLGAKAKIFASMGDKVFVFEGTVSGFDDSTLRLFDFRKQSDIDLKRDTILQIVWQ